jgi:uncharacterized membrane protein YbhN (UPF0104 family)
MSATEGKKKPGALLWVVVIALFAALLWWLHGHVVFNWRELGRQLRGVSVVYAAAAIGLIYFSFWLRGVRWAILLAPVKKASAAELVPPQLIGFTAVALIGRIADLTRPYLIARRMKVSVASQLAIYSVERAFDLGAAAILFSVTLAFAPRDLPHHSAYMRAGALSLAATLFIVVFAVALRMAGERVAGILRRAVAPLSKNVAEKVAERVLDFREGLKTVSSLGEFGAALAVSLVMWGGIAGCYLLTAHAFVGDPVLGHLSFTAMMLVFATSLGGSLLQLPVLGWFTQIALIAAAFHGFFGVRIETATACSALLLFDTTLCIVPAGLIAARMQGTSLRAAVRESEAVAVDGGV